MKPSRSPNWQEYDKSGRVIRQRFYSPDRAPLSVSGSITATIPDDQAERFHAAAQAATIRANPDLFADPIAKPAKPPRPRRTQ